MCQYRHACLFAWRSSSSPQLERSWSSPIFIRHAAKRPPSQAPPHADCRHIRHALPARPPGSAPRRRACALRRLHQLWHSA
jgi:hypothetical protein